MRHLTLDELESGIDGFLTELFALPVALPLTTDEAAEFDFIERAAAADLIAKLETLEFSESGDLEGEAQ